jgi:hypothetical protein
MTFEMNNNIANQMLRPPLASRDSASSLHEECYEEAQVLVAEILEIFGSLAAEADLQPRKSVNDKFSNLVNLCTKPRENCVVSAVLSDPSVQEIAPQLRELCSEGEAHLETYWAQKIIDTVSGSIQGGMSDAWPKFITRTKSMQKPSSFSPFRTTTTMLTCVGWNTRPWLQYLKKSLSRLPLLVLDHCR